MWRRVVNSRVLRSATDRDLGEERGGVGGMGLVLTDIVLLALEELGKQRARRVLRVLLYEILVSL